VQKKLTVNVYSFYNTGSTSVSVSYNQIIVKVLQRAIATSTCQSTDGQTCVLSGGVQQAGYGVGDLIALERYNGGVLTDSRFSYVKDISTAGKLTFTNSEPTTDVWSGATTQNPASTPAPRYGGQFSTDPRNPTLAYLWEGNDKGLSQEYLDHAQVVWQFNTATNTWVYAPISQPNTADSGYTMQYENMIPQNIVYTSSSTSGVNPALDTSSNSQTLQLDTTVDSAAIAKAVVGSSVLIERQNASGSAQTDRQSWHGTITSIPDYNGNQIVVKHNGGFSGDSGITVNSASVKVIINYGLTTWDFYNNTNAGVKMTVNRTATGLEIYTASSAENRVPAIGTTIFVTKLTGNVYDAYSMTVTNRTFTNVGGSQPYKFTLTGTAPQMLAGPIPMSWGSNALVVNGSNTTLTTSGDQIFALNGLGSVEWYLTSNTFNDNPQWRARQANSSATFGSGTDYPSPKKAAAVGSIYYAAGTESKIYEVGGNSGRFTRVWREEKSGNDPNDANRPTWSMLKDSAMQSGSLPELSGGSLSVYQAADGTTKAVYFGGKYKSEMSGYDYAGWQMGPAIGSFVSTSSSPTNGSYFYAYMTQPADDSTAYGFRNTVFGDYSQGSDFSSVKDSLNLVDKQQTAMNTCNYIADTACNSGSGKTGGQQLLKLGNAGIDQSGGWTNTNMVLGPGSAFLSNNNLASLILSGPTIESSRTSTRYDAEGYYPYQADTAQAGFGTLATNYATDKTLMLAGYSEIKDNSGNKLGGALLVTPAGVGLGWLTNRSAGARGYSYIAASQVDSSYAMKSGALASEYLTWIPDPEDVLFTLNAAKVMASANIYKVVGYYGNVRRGYLATAAPGVNKVMNLLEIVP
ncbi:MAG TPA: hypothetical protein VMQ44_00320, partial [Candidatus Saccharimonadales bacterium]|nr:hypothetical protein [Candidatus Saccharimonadales bacterium]